jgi:hypothetical protein
VEQGTFFETNPTELQKLCDKFVGVHNWHNFTSTRSHLAIFKVASSLSNNLLHESKSSQFILNTNHDTQTKQKIKKTKENYDEEDEDEDEDEDENDEFEDEEEQQLDVVENVESGTNLFFLISDQ